MQSGLPLDMPAPEEGDHLRTLDPLADDTASGRCHHPQFQDTVFDMKKNV